VSTDLAAELANIQHARFERLWATLSVRQRKIVARSLDAFEEDLNNTRRGSWSAASSASTMIQIAQATKGLSSKQLASLRRALPGVAAQAQDSTAKWLELLDKSFTGSATPLRWDTLEWLEGYRDPLLRSRLRIYRKSFARYGAQAVSDIEDAIAQRILVGAPWTEAREDVMAIVREQVEGKQWMVDRIVRTETSVIANATTMAALHEEDDDPDDPMLKKLVATFDAVTGQDSRMLHGQTRRLSEPFRDNKGHEYMAPPNRPNDREIVVGWRNSWGDDEAFDQDTAIEEDEVVDPGEAVDVDMESAVEEAVEDAEAAEAASEKASHPKPPPMFKPIGVPLDQLPKYGTDEFKNQIPTMRKEWKASRDEFSLSLNRLADYHDEQAGGAGIPFKTPADALRAMSERGIDISDLPIDAEWVRVLEAELRQAQRNPAMCDLYKITAMDVDDGSGASMTVNKNTTPAGAPIRATVNVQAHRFDDYEKTLDRDMADVAGGETPWLASARLSSDLQKSIVDRYNGIMPDKQLIQLVHGLRHELAHGYDFNLAMQTRLHVDDKQWVDLHAAWREARRKVDKQTWYWDGAEPEVDKWGDVIAPVVGFRPMDTSGPKFSDTWMAVGRYAETDDDEKFAESMAMAMSGNWDQIPPTLRGPLRAILGLTTG